MSVKEILIEKLIKAKQNLYKNIKLWLNCFISSNMEAFDEFENPNKY